MPMDAYVDAERRCVVVIIEGDFTLEDVVRSINRAVADPKFRPGFGILSDHTKVGEPITADQARQVVNHLASLSDSMANARWAAVTSKPASYGMLRMISTLAESVPMEVEIFPTMAEAEAWLLSSPAGDT